MDRRVLRNNPRQHYAPRGTHAMRVASRRQVPSEALMCGTQPADISMADRRLHMSVHPALKPRKEEPT